MQTGAPTVAAPTPAGWAEAHTAGRTPGSWGLVTACMFPDGCPCALGQPSPRTGCPGWGNPEPKRLRRKDRTDLPLWLCSFVLHSVCVCSVGKDTEGTMPGPATHLSLRSACGETVHPACLAHWAHLSPAAVLHVPVASQEGSGHPPPGSSWTRHLQTLGMGSRGLPCC